MGRRTRRQRVVPLLASLVLVAVLAVAAAVSIFPGSVPGERSAGPPGGDTAPTGAVDPYDPRLSLVRDGERRHRAAQITSTFENATLELQYGYAENIGDGRGITAGRAGFTSATGDLLLFVRRYTELYPGNVLAGYLPALEAVEGTDSEEGLGGFRQDWARAARDPRHRQLQDAVVDELYFRPAMERAAEVGLRTPLGQAIMWDTMIQHGSGGEHGTRSIIAETNDAVGTARGNEAAWLHAFLDVRLRHLLRSYDGAEADAASRSRIGALRSLLEDGELALEPPVRWSVYGRTFTVHE